MRRPGYLAGYRTLSPKTRQLGDDITARQAIQFMRGNSAIPQEIETGYIPESMRYSDYFPYQFMEIDGFNRRSLFTSVPGAAIPTAMFPKPRDPMTFNTLMI